MPENKDGTGIRICRTIGHSTHPLDRFVELLQAHGADTLADVRSVPYSRFNPQFNRETLKTDLELDDIRYLFLGDRLGARREEPEACYPDGTVCFEKIRCLDLFQQGIDEVYRLLHEGRHPVLMCAEKDPFDCHRFALVSRELAGRGIAVDHILATGEVVSQSELEDRLLEKYKLATPQATLFDPVKPRPERLAEAYDRRNREMVHRSAKKSAAPSR